MRRALGQSKSDFSNGLAFNYSSCQRRFVRGDVIQPQIRVRGVRNVSRARRLCRLCLLLEHRARHEQERAATVDRNRCGTSRITSSLIVPQRKKSRR